ncbi:hypothetical protein KP509_08G056600 [Ceratopteris richardii]|uniref:glycerophosphodiester phosphodiesterase n=1 Tax=Ceratopteris richardii TaxID=49495 RepID=A0A8T2U882_CERRI|nr:hypothetical protein KP509_08G056600 [Ceratopteris richardii]
MLLLFRMDANLRRGYLIFVLTLTYLATASSISLPEAILQRLKVGERIPRRPQLQIQEDAAFQRRMRSSLHPRIMAESGPTWNTLDGSPPLIIAHGGASGLFPDQTAGAYIYAASTSLQNTALSCDVQLTKDGYGICRTGINLGDSTTINATYPQLATELIVNGELIQGFFSVNLTASFVLNNISAVQSNAARTIAFDGMFPVTQPTDMIKFSLNTSLFWINVEYPSFFYQHGLNMTSYIHELISNMPIDFVSSPEVGFLKTLKSSVPKTTNLVLKVGETDKVDPSTNITYGSLLSNLSDIATYASGILVHKEYIWPVDNATLYLEAESTIIREAHKVQLAVYGYGFVNDPMIPIYNYSFDPIREYLQFVPASGSHIDGFLSDFPTTASEAIACFRGATPAVRLAGTKPFIISHNGDSGNYPGCTKLAYDGAVRGGASYIDCPVQMTSDGIAICRESPDLLIGTDVSTHSDFLKRLSLIRQFQAEKGIFSINMTWAEIQTLKATMFSPEEDFNVIRNPAYNNQEGVLQLTDFLNYAKNTSVGILIDIQNGYFLETEVDKNVVGAVLASLNASGLASSDRVMIQSEDSAILSLFRQVTNYTLIYRVVDTDVLVTKTEVSDVKALANFVTLPRALVQVASNGFLVNKTDIVDLFHAQNVSVFVSFLRNEFVALPYDYDSDPTLELDTLLKVYNVDGVITDFPATASYYLSNTCSNMKTQAIGGQQYGIQTVVPGALVTQLALNIQPPPPSQARLNFRRSDLQITESDVDALLPSNTLLCL